MQKSYNNLWHKEVFKKLLETKERELTRKRLKEDDKAVQPRIDETMDSLNPYSKSSQLHMVITKAVGRMIATDFQPFSLVEDKGFQLLLRTLDRQYQLSSRKHFSEKVIPQMCAKVKQKVSTVVKSALCLAITTDCWTSHSTDSYISVNSHFIDDKFNRQLAVLNTFQCMKGTLPSICWTKFCPYLKHGQSIRNVWPVLSTIMQLILLLLSEKEDLLT